MKPTTQVLVAVQVFTTIALFVASALGETSLRSNGLHIHKLAYENIGFTVLVACLASCLLASYFLAVLTKSCSRSERIVFLAASLTAVLSASAFANAPVGFSINGGSPELISWPALVWIAALFCVLVFSFSACRPKTDTG